MMGERRVMQEALFYSFSLERHVPSDHLLRKIDRFVDLSEVRAHLEPYYSEIGRPSIDPELMMRLLIVGYCFGIRSERRLCDEVHLNLAYRWFCRLGAQGAQWLRYQPTTNNRMCEDNAMTTEELDKRLRGIRGCWDQALAHLQEVSGGLEAIVKTPGENDLVAIAKYYGRDPKVFAIGMFDAVIMLKALTTVLEMTEPMLKKILPLTVEENLDAQDEVLHRLLDHVEAQGSA
jgi:transposase